MLREEPAPSNQNELGNLTAQETGNQRPLANAYDGAEENERKHRRDNDEEDVDADPKRPERAAPAAENGEHHAFWRKNRDAREHHGGDADAYAERAEKHEADALDVGFRCDEGGDKHRDIEDKAESRTDRQLSKRFLEDGS